MLYSSTNQEIMLLKDGVVELSTDGNHWVRATYLPEKQHFFLTKEEFPIEEGGTYYIRASHDGYESVSSSCTVPYTHDVSFRFDTVEANGDIHLGMIYNWPHRDVYAEWRDVSGEENAYAVVLKQPILEYYSNPVTGEETIMNDCYYEVQWLYKNNMDYRYVSDIGQDGAVLRYMISDDIYDPADWEDEEDEEEPGQYFLFFLDRNCYQYEKSLSTDNELNFLLLEPVHTYNNIENGFGLFGAFSMLQIP